MPIYLLGIRDGGIEPRAQSRRGFRPPRLLGAWLVAAAMMSMDAAFAEEPATETKLALETKPEVVILWPDGAPGAKGDEPADKPRITVYRAPAETANGAAVVICPGGGYGHLAVGHEGLDVAKWLGSVGVTAFVLEYRIAPRYRHPAPIDDARRAVRTVRARAADWDVDPDRIGIIGFSAGGHLASTAATWFESGKPDAKDPIERVSSRPDFLILGYPVITFTQDFMHAGSRRNLLGDDLDPKLVERLSNEKQVTKDTPPTFLFHTTEDTAVPPENSIAFYLGLRAAGVPAELHIYEPGRHGVGLAPADPILSTWPERCRAWMEKRGYLTRKTTAK
jgi:acetyl esterase/lipase